MPTEKRPDMPPLNAATITPTCPACGASCPGVGGMAIQGQCIVCESRKGKMADDAKGAAKKKAKPAPTDSDADDDDADDDDAEAAAEGGHAGGVADSAKGIQPRPSCASGNEFLQ